MKFRPLVSIISDLLLIIGSVPGGSRFQVVVIQTRTVIAVEQVHHDELAVQLRVELRLFGGESLIAQILVKEGVGREIRQHVGEHHVKEHRDEGGEHESRDYDGHGLHEDGALALLAHGDAHHDDDEHQAEHAREQDAHEGPEGIVRDQLVGLDAEHQREYHDEGQAQDIEQRLEDCEPCDLPVEIFFLVSGLRVFHIHSTSLSYSSRTSGASPSSGIPCPAAFTASFAAFAASSSSFFICFLDFFAVS